MYIALIFGIKLCINFWNKIADLPKTDLLYHVMIDNIIMATGGITDCWAHHFIHSICALEVLPNREALFHEEANGDITPVKIHPEIWTDKYSDIEE